MKVEIGQIICLYCSWNWRLWIRRLQLWSRCCYFCIQMERWGLTGNQAMKYNESGWVSAQYGCTSDSQSTSYNSLNHTINYIENMEQEDMDDNAESFHCTHWDSDWPTAEASSQLPQSMVYEVRSTRRGLGAVIGSRAQLSMVQSWYMV